MYANRRATGEETEEWDRWIEHTLQNRAKSKAAISEIVGFEFKNVSTPDIEKQWALLYKKTAGDQKKESRRLTGRERSEELTSELQSRGHIVCRLLLEKKN